MRVQRACTTEDRVAGPSTNNVGFLILLFLHTSVSTRCTRPPSFHRSLTYTFRRTGTSPAGLPSVVHSYRSRTISPHQMTSNRHITAPPANAQPTERFHSSPVALPTTAGRRMPPISRFAAKTIVHIHTHGNTSRCSFQTRTRRFLCSAIFVSFPSVQKPVSIYNIPTYIYLVLNILNI